jgi:glucokinase
MAYVIGFDLGGTKMLSAVVDEKLSIASRQKKKTSAHTGDESIYRRIKECIRASIKNSEIDSSKIKGIGVASPGPIDRDQGIILDTPNLGFTDFPIKKRLEADFGMPAVIDNDVSAGLYGEFLKGAAQGYRNVVGLFPGTGVGGGMILDGRLFRGSTGNAGEIGHTIIQVNGPLCGCGQQGCVEALASRTAIAKDAVALASAGAIPGLLEDAGTDFKRYRSGVIARAYKNGEKSVVEIVDRSAWYLGIAMANCVNILNPEIIVLGGGLIEKLGDPYVRIAKRSMREHSLPALVKNVKVRQARLGDDAAVIGAARIISEEIAEN